MSKEDESGDTTESTSSPNEDPYVAALKIVPTHVGKKLLELLNLKDAQFDPKLSLSRF